MSLGSPCEGSSARLSIAAATNLRPAAAYESSNGPRAGPTPSERRLDGDAGYLCLVARYAPLVPLVAGALLLILGEFLTVREIRAVTVVPPGGTETGGALHGYALGIVGLAILPMSYGAVIRGARPAAVALLVLALAACAIVVFVDRPVLDDTGLIGRTYDLAEARPAVGFFLESLGAALALLGAVATLTLVPQPAPRARATADRG
jgi:hypothetical protein